MTDPSQNGCLFPVCPDMLSKSNRCYCIVDILLLWFQYSKGPWGISSREKYLLEIDWAQSLDHRYWEPGALGETVQPAQRSPRISTASGCGSFTQKICPIQAQLGVSSATSCSSLDVVTAGGQRDTPPPWVDQIYLATGPGLVKRW